MSIASGMAGAASEPAMAPLQGQSAEQTERDKTECLAVALEALVSPPEKAAPAGGQSTSEASEAQAKNAGTGRPGLFGGLRRVDDATSSIAEPVVEGMSGEENQTVLDQAYAKCLRDRGYSVN